LYIVSKDGSIEEIDLRKEFFSFTLHYFYGQIVLAGQKTIREGEPDHSMKTINLPNGDSLYGLVQQGKENEIIAFANQPVEKEGKRFAEILISHLDSNQVTKRLLPAPQFEELTEAPTSTGTKYNGMFIGVSADLKKLYYSYQVAETGDYGHGIYTRLGMFDTEKEEELPYVYDRCCPPMGGYFQYDGYLMVNHFPEAGGMALVLNMRDLSSAIDLYKVLEGEETSRLSIHPFGPYFIVGTVNKVFLFSRDGDVLQEYPLPPDLIGQDYTIVEYTGDTWRDKGK